MAILHKRMYKGYTQLDNYSINDKRLSLKGKGMLLYMMSKPNEWKFNYKSFKYDLKESRDSIQSVIKELKELKYLEMRQFKNIYGRWEWNYTISDIPLNMPIKNYNLPQQDFPVMEKPLTEKTPILVNTKISNDKIDKEIYNLNLLTKNLIGKKYIDSDDLSIFYYDDLFNNLLNQGYTYNELTKWSNYLIDNAIKNKFNDMEGNKIENKYGYFKRGIENSIGKFYGYKSDTKSNLDSESNLFDYNWLDDEEKNYNSSDDLEL